MDKHLLQFNSSSSSKLKQHKKGIVCIFKSFQKMTQTWVIIARNLENPMIWGPMLG